MEQYKAEIKKLQASEAEIKALSVNYAALLKEKEVWLVINFQHICTSQRFYKQSIYDLSNN